MKNLIKLIALLTAIALIALSLCSCEYLDKRKADQAFYTDSTKKTVTYHDQTYKYLNTGKYDMVFNYYGFDYENTRFVTEQDVPPLLSRWYGDWYTVDVDATILDVQGDCFVREDMYDETKTVMEHSTLDHYFIRYYNYDPENFQDYIDYGAYVNVLLDDDTTAAINRTLSIPDNKKLKYDTLDTYESDQVDIIGFYHCDKNMMLSDFGILYLIRDWSRNYYIWDGNAYDEYGICPVAKEDLETIKVLFDKYSTAIESDSIAWYFENNYYNYDGYDVSAEYEELPQTVGAIGGID